MKIGLVLSKVPAYSETFFINKIKGLHAANYEVALFVQAQDPNFSLCPVYVAPSLPKTSIFRFGYFMWEYLKLLRYPQRLFRFLQLEITSGRSLLHSLKNGYHNAHLLKAQLDWLHFGFATMALQSENVAKAIGAKMAVSFRGFDMAIYPLKHPQCYDLLWQQVDQVHSISDDLLHLAYNLGLSRDKVFQKITPAIDLAQFRVDENHKRLFDRKNIQFLTVARLHWKKGLLYTLEALAKLKDEGYTFKYTIVGEGLLYEELMFAIHQLRMADEVVLIGKKEHSEIVDLLRQTDIYLQYSISEGFCNAVLEAQAMGCLCIVSDAEGLSENILNNQTGWVVCKNKPLLLAKTIDYVIKLTEIENERIRYQAKERIYSQFNLEKQINDFIQFYSTLS